MIDQRPIVKKTSLTVSLLLLLSFVFSVRAQDVAAGKALFNGNCASCHAVHRVVTGPALAGIEQRVPDKKKLYSWIKNSAAVLATGDPYFTELYNQYNKTPMNPFPNLEDTDIANILAYINSVPVPTQGGPGGDNNNKQTGSANDNALVFGIVSLILAVVALILLQVNSNLRKLADDREGLPSTEPIPFYRNKTYIALATILLFVVGGFYTIQGAIGLQRQQNYQPEQPIYFSHKVHAGLNQINCMYCHSGAWDSKHAGIPSINVCMNCHQSISTYEKGPELTNADGETINGTAEIQKLYKAAGFTPGQLPWDPAKGKAIEWVKIHNLPDHVYFNHSQHVRAGKVQCQTCHGEITAMDEVKQFADLSMGWCVNCHRTSKVDFPDSTGKNGNQFYSIYQKFHNDIKEGRMDSVTVKDIGGLECQKCHY
ncbi:MAG TPA: c-type cytochrome [Chitinophagaceae bacterium]|nr:c-type cytochrome [Chitinophagaceae bacterium]